MTIAELIKQLRGCKDIAFCTDCPRRPKGIMEQCDIKDAAADALEAADKRIAELEEIVETMNGPYTCEELVYNE